MPTTTRITNRRKALFTDSVESTEFGREVAFGATVCLGWKISIKQNSESAGGTEAAFCQIQYHLEYWSKVIQNFKPAEKGGNQNSFISYYLADTLYSFNPQFTITNWILLSQFIDKGIDEQ